MKIILAGLFVFGLCWASPACAQGIPWLPLPLIAPLPGDVQVKPYAQVGFQHLGSNICLPVNSEPHVLSARS
jgi:hypothetical protein